MPGTVLELRHQRCAVKNQSRSSLIGPPNAQLLSKILSIAFTVFYYRKLVGARAFMGGAQ